MSVTFSLTQHHNDLIYKFLDSESNINTHFTNWLPFRSKSCSCHERNKTIFSCYTCAICTNNPSKATHSDERTSRKWKINPGTVSTFSIYHQAGTLVLLIYGIAWHLFRTLSRNDLLVFFVPSKLDHILKNGHAFVTQKQVEYFFSDRSL